MKLQKYFNYMKRVLEGFLIKFKSSKTHVYYVGKNKEYKSLKECIEHATKYMNSIVYVQNGIYDLYDEFGEEYFNNFNKFTSNRAGIILKNRVHIIFADNVKVIFNYKGDNEYVKTKFSPFNTGDYGFTLENAVIECSNCRYCVHDEMHASLFKYKNVYINCKMKMDNSKNIKWNTYQCIGGGLGIRGDISVINCEFSTLTKESYPAISWHNRSGIIPSRSNILVSKCNFADKNTFRLNSYGKFKSVTIAILSNNKFGAKVVNEKTTSDSFENTKIIEFNNKYI